MFQPFFYILEVLSPLFCVPDSDPCLEYHLLDMKDGMRHVNFKPSNTYLCDEHGISTGLYCS